MVAGRRPQALAEAGMKEILIPGEDGEMSEAAHRLMDDAYRAEPLVGEPDALEARTTRYG